MAKKRKGGDLLKKVPEIDFSKLDFTDKRQGFTILIIGIALALILGAFAANYAWTAGWLFWMMLIGIAVGVLNIFHEEGLTFIIVGLTLTLMLSVLTGLGIFADWIVILFQAVIVLLAPASIVVSLKVVYALMQK